MPETDHDTCVAILDDTGRVRTLAEIEREVIEVILIANDGDKRLTARELGIALKTLYNKLNSWKAES